MYPIFVRLARLNGAVTDGAVRVIAAEIAASSLLVFEHAHFRAVDNQVEGVVFVLAVSTHVAVSSVRHGLGALIKDPWRLETCEIDLLHVNALWIEG